MEKDLYIDASHPDETRIVLKSKSSIEEYEFEGKNKLNFSKKNRNIHFIENNLDYMDLWIMSLCTHNIINKSTFSWWGAYLNKNDDKIIIAPKKSIFCEKKQKDIWVKQLYFPEWIILDE